MTYIIKIDISKIKQCETWKLCKEIATSEFWSFVGISMDMKRLTDFIKKLSLKGGAFLLIKTCIMNLM